MASRAILHVDMDAFYASVEQRDDSSLRGKPVIVGGHPTRGVVLAASYEVRPFGVRSAMPISRALRLCPHAAVVPPRFDAYAQVSDQVAEIFAEVTPLIEPLSLDEAFLDVTSSQSLFGSGADIARRLRGRIQSELQLPSSAGIAACKFVAKIATDVAKPNGQREVLEDQTQRFLDPLPVGRLWGVGPKTEAVLHKLGVATIGDLRVRGETWLAARLGDQGRTLYALSLGQDDRPVVPDRQQKSVGAEDTFSEDTLNLEFLLGTLHAQSWRIGRRLRRNGLRGRVVAVKLKDLDFKVSHRRTTLPQPTDDGQEIFATARALLQRSLPPKPLRLIGVSAESFSEEVASDLFAAAGDARRSALNSAIDRITDKFGLDALRPLDIAGRPDRAAGKTPVDDFTESARRPNEADQSRRASFRQPSMIDEVRVTGVRPPTRDRT